MSRFDDVFGSLDQPQQRLDDAFAAFDRAPQQRIDQTFADTRRAVDEGLFDPQGMNNVDLQRTSDAGAAPFAEPVNSLAAMTEPVANFAQRFTPSATPKTEAPIFNFAERVAPMQAEMASILPQIAEVIKKFGLAGFSLLPPTIASYLSQKIKPVDHDPFAEAPSNGSI